MNDEAPPFQSGGQDIRARLAALRDALLVLHKSLLESERVQYEKTMGPIQSPNDFLHLLATDPWFAWLSPLTRLVVDIDEATECREPLTSAAVEAMVSRTFSLLVTDEAGQGFGKEYFEALQRDPDVVMAHAGVAKMRPKSRGSE